jgi:hypothetical protein
MKKCDACDSQLREDNSGFGVYRSVYYFDRFSKEVYGAYIKNIHLGDVGAEYNVMLCRSCQDKNKKHICIPDYIPEEQYKK